MKHILILGFIVGLFGCSDQAQEGVKLTGNVEQFPKGGFAYVERVGENGIEPFDTLNVDSNGDFSEYLKIEKPAFFRVNFNGNQIISLILTGEEDEVVLNAQGNDPRGFSEVSGSYDTEYKNQIDAMMQEYRVKVQGMQQAQRQARANNDAQAFQTAQFQMMDVAKKTEAELKALIREASPSLAAFYGLQMIDATQNFEFIDSIAMELQAEMPENFHVESLLSQVATKKSLAIGKEAPEIALENPEGEIIKLSSLRGKYVLIDFWAAWCRPCRAENPNVVRVYNEYSDENFEILGVSLDRTREKWLGAIEQDGLPWLHVSDLKYWRSQAAIDYQVNAIPATFLIDPEGKIIAKNLRGASLEAKLKEIFG
ncbi:TlpA disulfide reductase family protein [Ekhidna sp. MALMAid0563]|uniref:TlpA family protein disulfide reductase n=1 Tax=Ekhidna sp. MALMAid0563 TaxID=3143937 RepID=UPI0032DF7955